MEQPIVEITLQSLQGIVLTDHEHTSFSPQQQPNKVPRVTAAVVFSGSAADMQVASSKVCSRTGNLMVESHLATTLPRSSKSKQPMIAHWNHADRNVTATTAGLQQQQQGEAVPHATVFLPQQDPRLPVLPLSKTNRDSQLVSHQQRAAATTTTTAPSMDSSDVSSCQTNGEKSPEYAGGGSVFWSEAGEVMPEIIELNLNLKVDTDHLHACSNHIMQETPSLLDDNTITTSWDEGSHSDNVFEIGVAYLVLFGNHQASTLLDLPVKKIKRSAMPDNSSITIDENATLRVRVNVYPSGKQLPNNKNNGAKESPRLLRDPFSQLHDSNVLERILRQLQIAEDRMAERMARRHGGGGGHHPSIPGGEADHPMPTTGIFCGMLNLFKCDVDGEDDFTDTLYGSETMDSTLITSPSMNW